MKLNLLTNATVLDDAIRFVEQGEEKFIRLSNVYCQRKDLDLT